MGRYILYILLLLGSGVTVPAQNVVFKATAKNVVQVGERFQLVYMLNTEGQNFRGPDLSKFRVLSGPSTSQSSSIQIINGNVTRTVEYSFTYLLQGLEEGIIDIAPAKITVAGNTVESNALKIQVVQGSAQQQSPQQPGGNQPAQSTDDTEDYSDDVFIRAVVDKTMPYQGEQVIITYKLYYRINIAAPTFQKEPTFKGFWVNDLLQDRKNYVQYTETYKGSQYQVAELKKVALFPQQTGKVTIKAMEATCQAQVRSASQTKTRDPFFDSFFNDPFFNRYKTIEIPLVSNEVTLNIKPLPTEGKPADYSGAVGNFDFSSVIDKTELKANEAINLKFNITGVGNVELIDKVNVKFPPDFEVYDPKVTKSISLSQGGVSGKKSFEYLLIPRNPGEFTIEPVNFTFFDLAKDKYVTLTTPAYTIQVAKGDGAGAGVVVGGASQSDIKYLGSDIRHIKSGNPRLRLIGSYFFGSGMYYILLAAPLLLFILFILIWKNELKKRSNLALMRNRKATKIARKRMKQAEQFLKENNKNQFYIEVSQALWGYLSDKFSIPMASLSIDTVAETLTRKEVKEETIRKFIDTLNHCEYARFAPGDVAETMDTVYNESVGIITMMEKELK